jgi:hypothetical protein
VFSVFESAAAMFIIVIPIFGSLIGMIIDAILQQLNDAPDKCLCSSKI